MKKLTVLFLTLFVTKSSFSTGLPVFDSTNLPHNVMAAYQAYEGVMKQIEMIQKYKEFYELQIKNTLAPAFWVWDKVANFEDNLKNLQNKLSYYANGGVEEYIKKFINPNFYKSSQCYKFGSCTKEEADRIREMYTRRQNELNEAFMENLRSIGNYFKVQESQDKRVLELQETIQSADGHMQSMQLQSQYLAEIQNSLKQLNKSIVMLNNQIASFQNLELESVRQNDAWYEAQRNFQFTREPPFKVKNLK